LKIRSSFEDKLNLNDSTVYDLVPKTNENKNDENNLQAKNGIRGVISSAQEAVETISAGLNATDNVEAISMLSSSLARTLDTLIKASETLLKLDKQLISIHESIKKLDQDADAQESTRIIIKNAIIVGTLNDALRLSKNTPTPQLAEKIANDDIRTSNE